MKLVTGALASGVLFCSAIVAACSGGPGAAADTAAEGPTGVAESADSVVDVLEGVIQFTVPLHGTNGRSCATCHVESEHFALSPGHVASVYAQNPKDPLFNPIDADDPTAAVPTYDHLKAGLVRVTLTLADNLDVIDASGNVITNADRTITVWRGVPTIENVDYTGPYQYDGRAATLPIQANGALEAHSQIDHPPSDEVLEHISDFEKTIYSDPRAAAVAYAIDHDKTPAPLDLHFPPGSDEAAGQVLFQNICALCHGTSTVNQFTSQAVHDSLFPVQNADGTIAISGLNPLGLAIPTTFDTHLQDHHEGNIGISGIAMLRQLGAFPNPSGLSLPQYRIRFYTDATRTTKMVDMPPAPPAIGPTLVAQPFSVDPGRAIISGDPYDWESFKAPQLRGISKTAPYFHDASAPDLHALLDEYSQLILPADPVLNLPYAYPPETSGGLPESLSPTQKAQLFAFLQKL